MDTRAEKSFTLRLPPELYEPIARMAERERRSLHGQVLYLLDRALEALEEEAAVRAYDAALATQEHEQMIPLEQAMAEIEAEWSNRE